MATAKKITSTKNKTVKKTSSAKKTSAAKKFEKTGVKPIERTIIDEILRELGLESFSRPYAGLIDSGDFGSVATYIPLYADEYKKLSKEMKEHVYTLGAKRYGIICSLPRTFESADGGKVESVKMVYSSSGKLLHMAYKTDAGGSFETDHELRREKLYNYAKNKKLPFEIVDKSANQDSE